MEEFVLTRDLVVPAGTVLSRTPDRRAFAGGSVEACVAVGRDSHAWLVMGVGCVEDAPPGLIVPRQRKRRRTGGSPG